MRVLVLTALTVVAVIYHGSQAVADKNSHNLLGRVLLRRALEAMSSKPGQINIKRRSLEENDDDESKNKNTMEDIFGSGSQEASGSTPSDVSQPSDQSGSGFAPEQTASGDDTDTEASAQSSGEQALSDDQQQTEESGSTSTASTTTDQASEKTEQTTVQVADKAAPNEPIVVAKNEDENAAKKSDIELASGEEASTKEQESNDETSSSSGDSDEVTSGQVADEEHDDGSAEAIRKGMESLSRLLKPVATTLDLQVYSGSAKPKDEDEEEEQKAVIKEVAKGEDDKEEKEAEEEKDAEKKLTPPKVKKCETVCKAPMTYQQCAVPRCSRKMGTIKDLCFFLCEHQKPHCTQVCKEV